MTTAVRYRVVRKIADGGMAEIFLARQVGAEGFEKPVVLKRILPAFASDAAFVRMFLDEAHIASTLSHSNIVQILDLGKSGEQYFLVLELVDGWSLEQVRKRAREARVKIPLPVALYIVGSLCRALHYAHTRTHEGRKMRIVHRDVSPHNVLLSREGDVKLADFGIAKAIGRREKSVSGVIKGKLSYMSPEQTQGTALDARSDLFAVGTVLYQLTVGRKPFEAASDVEVLLAIRRGRYERPSAVVKGFNPDVERLIARALRVDKAKRWQTGEQMADRIDAILAKLGASGGAGALKRWLADLAERDGARTVVDAAAVAPTEGTIELGTSDLELQHVTPPTVATRKLGTPSGATPPPGAGADETDETDDEAARTPAVRRSFAARVLRFVLVMGVLVALLGAGAYLGRARLPPWMVHRVEQWVAHVRAR